MLGNNPYGAGVHLLGIADLPGLPRRNFISDVVVDCGWVLSHRVQILH